MKKIVALFTMLAVLTACGGGGGRPSEGDIADAMKENAEFSQLTDGASDEVVDCIAKALHDSDLSDDALQAIVDGDEDYDEDEDDTKALADASADFAKCITG
jgi:hypothetical protein